MIGGQGVNVAGSLAQGFAVNLEPRGGSSSAPSTPAPTGACCLGDACSELNAADCATAGGLYQGDNTTCSPSPCAQGACCVDSVCSDGTELSCSQLGGIFQGIGTSCASTPCATGACCFGGSCVEPISQSDCETSDGVFLGNGSTCASPGCPSGACCFGGDCFEGYSADSCADSSGEYKGDFSVCDPNPCGACPSIEMTCDSISASKTKCGYDDGSGSVFLSKVNVTTWFATSTIGGGQFCEGDLEARLDFFSSGEVTFFTTTRVEPSTCIEGSPECETDGGTLVVDRQQTGDHEEKCDTFYTPCQDHSVAPACGSITPALSGGYYVGDPCGPLPVIGPFTTLAYENEYTTDMLKGITVDALPAYSGLYTGGACASSTYLSDDEKTYSIQRSKPKFSFAPSPIDFLLCYNEVFTPAGGGGGGTTTNTQCLSVSAGQTEVFGPELLEPSTNGTTSIRDITCTPV